MRVRLCALMMTLLLLLSTGCGTKTDPVREQTERFRGALATSDLAFTCQLNIDYGDRVYDFTLSYTREAGGPDILTVEEPESIAGLRVAIDGSSLEMLFEQARLETGTLDGGLSAVTALPMMLSAWVDGSISAIGKDTLDETDCYVIELLTYPGDEPLGWQLWLSQDSLLPLYAEVAADETVTVRCRFADFHMEPGTPAAD